MTLKTFDQENKENIEKFKKEIWLKTTLFFLKDSFDELKKTNDSRCACSCYDYLFSLGKVDSFDSENSIEMRKETYLRLKENLNLRKVREQFPAYFKILVGKHVKSDIVNGYLDCFDAFEEIIEDLKK